MTLVSINGNRSPHDVMAERALLGACMLDPEALGEVVDRLRPDDLHLASHRRIWQHIAAAHRKHMHPDIVVLSGRILEAEQGAECGGLDYVQSLPEDCPSSTGWSGYLDRIQELATRRRMLAAADHLVEQARESEDLESVVATTEALLADVEVSRIEPLRSDEVANLAWDTVLARMDAHRAGTQPGFPTGLPDLDALIGASVKPKKLLILAARPAMGKSALAMQIAVSVAESGHGVLVLSLEMAAEELMLRAWAAKTNVPLPVLESGAIAPAQLDRLQDAHAWTYTLPLLVADQFDQTVAAIRTAIRKSRKQLAKIGRTLDLVVVDYLQLVNLQQGRGESKADAVGRVSRALKGMSKEYACCVLCLSQLNRACEARTNKRPMLADLRDSGAIEQDADCVVFVYRDEVYYANESKFPGQAELLVAKQRAGRLGACMTEWEGQYTRFAPAVRRYS